MVEDILAKFKIGSANTRDIEICGAKDIIEL